MYSCTKQTSKFTDRQVFRYNEHSNITSLDPAFAKDQRNIWAVNQLFNGLVQLDDSLQIQPDIAKKWSISEDGKTYKFTLRNDVKFHKHSLFGKDSTRSVIATDFKYSLDRLLSKKVASPGGWVLQNVKNFKAENDSIFTINLKQAFPPFLGLLAMKYCSVVPKEAVDYFGNSFRANPIGTGAFQFKLWVENTKLVFRKNLLYFEKDIKGNNLPYLEAVAITFLPDKQSEYLQFIQGNLDFMKSLDASYKDDILNIDGSFKKKHIDKIVKKTGAYLNTEYLGIYLDGSDEYPTKSKLIRKAINYGFDRVKMIKFLRNGIGIPATSGFIPKGLPSFNNQKGYSYQPEKARALITKYIKETGDKNPEITITTNGNYLDLCEFIQRQLQNIGLQIKVDVIPPSTLRQGKANGKLPVFRASWIADYPDAENYLSLFYSENFIPNGPNYTHFKNDKFDALYEESIKEVDIKKRYKLYQKMDSIIIEEAPIVPLYYDEVIRFSQKNIQGLGINPIDMLHLKNVYKN
ncbi:ABC transporter substrate-binding protein [Tenacibaculum pacificus]|uniref:ABC transporter substrate-binding protein n=1 Tax=Tenacibaculum pacificus TaxID=3018314 RepID=UPI0022F4054D|nr:ABC transporter substrate-binding protein [Tenacibaculum pacificus]WBX74790.1 ABC transporter substrate-binding protein [Tenacibaculum pacificus]